MKHRFASQADVPTASPTAGLGSFHIHDTKQEREIAMQTKIDLNEQLNRYATTAHGQIGRGFSGYAGYAAAVGAGLAMAGGADASILYSGVQNIAAATDPSWKAASAISSNSVIRPLGAALPGLNAFAGQFASLGAAGTLPAAKYMNSAFVFASGGAKFLGAAGYSALNLAAGARIGPGSVFSASAAGLMAFHVVNAASFGFRDFRGHFAAGATGIAGIQLGNGNYGWIRLKVEDLGLNQPLSDQLGALGSPPLGDSTGFPDKITVIDWAVETSGGAIVAGDMGAPAAVPEPSALALLAAGAAGLARLRRRKPH